MGGVQSRIGPENISSGFDCLENTGLSVGKGPVCVLPGVRLIYGKNDFLARSLKVVCNVCSTVAIPFSKW
jgi:hypothetical protein